MSDLDHPFYEVAERAEQVLESYHGAATIFQKWSCAECGARQTMDIPNTFFTVGQCEECGGITDIVATGCNYMLVVKHLVPASQVLIPGPPPNPQAN